LLFVPFISFCSNAAGTAALEGEIDERVYRLYGLTPEEVHTVEQSVGLPEHFGAWRAH